MNRWLKRAFIAGLTLLTLLAALVVVEHSRGRRALGERLAALNAQGEVLSVPALEPQRPSPDQNVVPALLSLTNRLKDVLTNSSIYPPSLRFVAPGRAVVTAGLKEWIVDRKATCSWAQIEQDLAGAADVLAGIRAAAARPGFDSGFDYRKGFVDFQLGSAVLNVKRAAQSLSIATLLDLHEGQLDAAHSHLCALVRLAVNQRPEPLVICQLVRQACVAIAFNATWQALQTPGWTEPQLAALQSAWTACELSGDMGKAFEMERAMVLDFYRQIRTSRAALNQAIGQREDPAMSELTGPLPTEGFWLHYVHLPIWRLAWSDQDALRALERWNVMIERGRLAQAKSWSALPGRPAEETVLDSMPWLVLFQDQEQMGWYDRLRFLFSAEPFSVTDALLRRTLATQTQQQMVLTAIAAARYRTLHGTDPSDLAALVPDLLPVLPKDWMDGGTLRFRARRTGGYLLYSVGEDGDDSDGDPTPSKPGKTRFQLWDGRDAVWPTPATGSEAEAAMMLKAE